MDNKTIIGVLSAVAIILIGITIYQRYYADAQSFVAGAPVRIIGIEYKQNRDVAEVAQLAQRAIDIVVAEQYVNTIDIYLRMIINETRRPDFKQRWDDRLIHNVICGDIKITPMPSHDPASSKTILDVIKNMPGITPVMLNAAVKLNTFIRQRFCVNGITDVSKIITFLKAIRASIPNAKPFNEETQTIQPVAVQATKIQTP